MDTRKIVMPVSSVEVFLEIARSILENKFYYLKGWDDFQRAEEIAIIVLFPDRSKLFLSAEVQKCFPESGSIITFADLTPLQVYLNENSPHEVDIGDEQSKVDSGPNEGFADAILATAEIPAMTEAEPDPMPDEDEDNESSRSTEHGVIIRMNVDEKKRYALKCGRSARNLLIRDAMKQVHIFVLKNPKLMTEEVEEYSRFPGLSPEAAKYIIHNPSWFRSKRVKLNMARNPALPPAMTMMVLQSMHDNDLRNISRNAGLRPDVIAAAKKLLISKGKL